MRILRKAIVALAILAAIGGVLLTNRQSSAQGETG